ncbi:uncharacterized protein PAC_16338 [Phialocephala subalpina]|uniref:Uncharacterized protein n=1 Tax=Phialocephala subalpina TaxID=576137 RepID=A0A1L7XNB7_9HELO|nr:uncharacterized protein PAC_16338 [Phialocephala subalpina]
MVIFRCPNDEDLWRDHFVSGYQEEMANTSRCRRFFFTTRGYMGLGPPNVAVGVEIAFFFSGLTPYVLRAADEGLHDFVGEVYVLGIMHEEAMKELGFRTRAREFAL